MSLYVKLRIDLASCGSLIFLVRKMHLLGVKCCRVFSLFWYLEPQRSAMCGKVWGCNKVKLIKLIRLLPCKWQGVIQWLLTFSWCLTNDVSPSYIWQFFDGTLDQCISWSGISEWGLRFIWSNLNGFFSTETITCIFCVSKELLNPGQEDSTIFSCYLRCLESIMTL